MKDYRSYISPAHRGDPQHAERILRRIEAGDVVAGITLSDQDPIKSEITLMGAIAYCKYCPEWTMVPLVRRNGWTSHCCDTILHRYVTSERERQDAWVEKIKRSKCR